MANILEIFPTSRAIRERKKSFLKSNSLLPKMTTIADFENKAIVLKDYKLIDNSLRALYLKRVKEIKDFTKLKDSFTLVKFYSHAKDFFRFFEEIVAEKVSFDELLISDTYAEFDKDLKILEKLLKNYKELIKKDGYTDKIFIPKEYSLNKGYINSFDGFILELEGYLTKFELELFEKISQYKDFIIKTTTTNFNQKMIKHFKNLGIELESGFRYEFNLSSKKILKKEKIDTTSHIEVIEVDERIEQIAIVNAKIANMVEKNNIKPCKIAIITPDETFAKYFKIFDSKNNFNLAMGIDFKTHSSYKILENIYKTLKEDKLAKEFLLHFDIKLEFPLESLSIEEFFTTLKKLNISPYKEDNFYNELEELNLLQKYFRFYKLFNNKKFEFNEWLFLWLEELKEHSLDDIGGGKITIMGLLESRGVEFDAVFVVDFNDSVVPATSNKDRFLNSAVRKKASLPTIADRENLQKHYYYQLFSRAKEVVLTYQKSQSKSASKFLYELSLDKHIKRYKTPFEILYPQKFDYISNSFKKDIKVEFNPLKIEWSNYKLKTFLECKRKFYYRFFKKISEPMSDEINDGLLLHNILYQLFKKNRKFNNFEELKKAFLSELGKIQKSSNLKFKEVLWIELLEQFLQNQISHFQQGYKVVECEKSLKGKIGELIFSGRVDRIDKKGNNYLIIDYKSSSSKEANGKNIEKITNFQMNIYDELLGYKNKDFAFIELFEKGELIFLKEYEAKKERLFEIVKEIEKLKSFEAKRCEDLSVCRFCSFKLMCHRGEFL